MTRLSGLAAALVLAVLFACPARAVAQEATDYERRLVANHFKSEENFLVWNVPLRDWWYVESWGCPIPSGSYDWATVVAKYKETVERNKKTYPARGPHPVQLRDNSGRPISESGGLEP